MYVKIERGDDSVWQRAVDLALEAHGGQFDKMGLPYIMHPWRVMDKVAQAGFDYRTMAVAITHDVMEDYSEGSRAPFWMHNIPDDVIDAVELVSRLDDDEPYPEFIGRIADSGNQMAMAVKMADLLDNMSPWRVKVMEQIDPEKSAKRIAKYGEAFLTLTKAYKKLYGTHPF